MVDVDVVDDGQTPDTVLDQSGRFVIANHILDHRPDPIGTMLGCPWVVELEGTALLGFPDLRLRFDEIVSTPRKVAKG